VPASSLFLRNKRTAVFECDLLISQVKAVCSFETSGEVCPVSLSDSPEEWNFPSYRSGNL